MEGRDGGGSNDNSNTNPFEQFETATQSDNPKKGDSERVWKTGVEKNILGMGICLKIFKCRPKTVRQRKKRKQDKTGSKVMQGS